ncbi:MAG: mechanosensitive ion channel family protein [Flavobacteriaceae bacterium]|nr:mechanosensitive ion channel family protein [Flavobacteriaceae bacterium]MCB0475407.1 mechanosensitive ion channel family protein [Flavobacteriaceae bacterium]
MKLDIGYINELLDKWEKSTVDFVPKFVLAILVIAVFIGLAKILRNISLKFFLKTFKKEVTSVNIVASLIYFSLLISGVFIAFEILGLGGMLTKILASAGIVGIIAGFAFKDIASNAFAGLLLNIQRPFEKNDWVEINNNYGRVLEVGWITTSIKTISGQEVFVPNQLVYSNTFTNYSTFKKRRIILQTGVSYGDDLEHVKAVALDEVKKLDVLLPNEDIDFYFTDIGNSAYNFVIRFWIKFYNQVDYLNAMSETIMRLKKRFEKEKINIAYPVTTLDFGVKGGVNLFDKALKVDSVSTEKK